MNLSYKQILFGSPAYEASLQLRDEILRKPLGLSVELALDEEDGSFHIGCHDNLRLVGTLTLKPIDAVTLKMRQVAIAIDYQNKGVGTELVRFAEKFAAEAGYQMIIAHARETAVTFYRRMGYSVDEKMFLEVSLPHYRISKELKA